VAVFTSGGRIFIIGIIPLMEIATSVISVSGAAFGACRKDK